MMSGSVGAFTAVVLLSLLAGGSAEQCGWQGGGGTGGSRDISDIISESMFEKMLPHRNSHPCYAIGFYTYDAFISAAKKFPKFGNTGDEDTRKREIAAFLGQTSYATTGAPAGSGPYNWGYCWVRQYDCDRGSNYCDPKSKYPCVPGKKYCGRGPIQLSWNFNYGKCGDFLGLNLTEKPELVETDPIISFKTAIWFWMTRQQPKPSAHDVITGKWKPTDDDLKSGRFSGYGVITNIINGGTECGKGPNYSNKDRIGYYKNYTGYLGISPGPYLDCYQQKPFGKRLLELKDII